MATEHAFHPSGIGRPRAGIATRLCGVTAACSFVIGLLAGAPAAAQTTTLRGELLLRDGQPATGVRLVIVGHPPEVSLQDGGLFTQVLAGAPSEVTVRVVGSGTTEVLFPRGGRVVVPRDANAVVSIVVGEPIGAAVEDRVERDLRAIRETLEVRGIAPAEIEAVIRTELDALATRLENIARDAVVTAVAGAEQTEIRERVNRYLGTYVRVSRDLVDAFELIDVTGDISMSEFLALRDAMENYNQGFADLDRELTETPAAIVRAWNGEAGRELSERMDSVLALIHSDVHAEMLALREPLTVIQLEFTGSRPPRAELAAARRAVADALPRLQPALARLEEAMPPLIDGLRQNDLSR